MATLGPQRVMDLELHLPPAGGWWGTCHLELGPVPAAGAATLTVGDLALAGQILPDRGGLDSPDRPAVVVAGGYGWRTRLPAPGGLFESPTGVRLSTVLSALASTSGEAYDAPPEVLLGPSYGWTAGLRCRAALADLVARGAIPWWRVDPSSGRTVFARWPTRGAADAHGRIVDRDLARGIRYLGLDTAVQAWLPGATVQGATIARLILREHDSELRGEAWDA